MRAWLAVLASLAGLMGAAGVALSAAAAHVSGDATLKTAAEFLLFHATALVALCAASPAPRKALLASGSLIAAGSVLFSGDLAVRALAGLRLLPMAAPAGGLLLIAGWLVGAVALPLALSERAKRSS